MKRRRKAGKHVEMWGADDLLQYQKSKSANAPFPLQKQSIPHTILYKYGILYIYTYILHIHQTYDIQSIFQSPKY